MVAACCTGEAMGVTPPAVTARVIDVLRSARLPIGWPADVAADAAIALMQTDKKSQGGALRLVLIERLGDARIYDGVPHADVRMGLARAVDLAPM